MTHTFGADSYPCRIRFSTPLKKVTCQALHLSTVFLVLFFWNAASASQNDPHISNPDISKITCPLVHSLSSQVHQVQDWMTELQNRRISIDRLLEIKLDHQNHTRGFSSSTRTVDQLIQRAMNEAVAHGKRLRPLIAWELAITLGIDPNQLTPLYRAIEFAHASSLIFDDLPAQDNASTRRGQPTLHIKYSESTAQLAAVALLTQSIREIQNLEPSFHALETVKLTAYWTEVIGGSGISLGQAIDLASRQGKSFTETEYLELIDLKTGLAFEAPLVGVAILAKRTDLTEPLKELSRILGRLYQIKDDILDATGDQTYLGKPAGQDQTNETLSAIAVYTDVNGATQALEKLYGEGIELIKRNQEALGKFRIYIDYFYSRTR